MASSAWCRQFESLIVLVLSCPALSNSDSGKYKMCDIAGILLCLIEIFLKPNIRSDTVCKPSCHVFKVSI